MPTRSSRSTRTGPGKDSRADPAQQFRPVRDGGDGDHAAGLPWRFASARATYARCGIIVNVTPIEPEWRGEDHAGDFSNTTPLPAKIYANEGIAQLIFLKGERTCDTSYADKSWQVPGPTGADVCRGWTDRSGRRGEPTWVRVVAGAEGVVMSSSRTRHDIFWLAAADAGDRRHVRQAPPVVRGPAGGRHQVEGADDARPSGASRCTLAGQGHRLGRRDADAVPGRTADRHDGRLDAQGRPARDLACWPTSTVTRGDGPPDRPRPARGQRGRRRDRRRLQLGTSPRARC